MTVNNMHMYSEIKSHSTGSDVVYAGFWIRVIATTVDSILIALITVPLLVKLYGTEYLTFDNYVIGGWDVIISWILPAVAVVIFWFYRSATPGKMLVNIKIVDARTGGKPSTVQLITRYFAYVVAMLPLLLGVIWVAFDNRKQGWHDKLAGTVVIRIPKT